MIMVSCVHIPAALAGHAAAAVTSLSWLHQQIEPSFSPCCRPTLQAQVSGGDLQNRTANMSGSDQQIQMPLPGGVSGRERSIIKHVL